MKRVNVDKLLQAQASIQECAQAAQLQDDEDYERKANIAVIDWLRANDFEINEHSVQEVRNDFDYYATQL